MFRTPSRAAQSAMRCEEIVQEALRGLLSSSPLDRDTSWSFVDHRPASLDYREEKRQNRARQRGPPRYRRLYPESESLVPSRSPNEIDRAATVWDRDADNPNPVAPGAYIDFRRLNSTKEILEALERSQDYVQLRQIVAALSRIQSGGLDISSKAVHGMFDLARTTIGSARMEDVVGVFLASSRFRVVEQSVFLNDLAKLAIERGYPRQMSIRELATMIHTCVTLLRHAEKRVSNRIARSAIDASRSTTAPSGFEEHGEFASGMAAVEELLNIVIEEFVDYREADGEMELRLPSVIKSLSFLGRKDERLDRLIEKLASSFSQLRSASEEQMAALIFAVANSGSVKRDVIERLTIEVTKLERLASLATNQLIGIIDAFSQLETLNRGAWISIYAELAQESRLEELTVTQWPIVVRSLVKSEMYRDRELLSKIFAAMLSRDRLLEMGPRQLIRCVSIVCDVPNNVRISGGDSLLPVVADRAVLNRLNPVAFVRFVHGLSKFMFTPGSRIASMTRDRRLLEGLSNSQSTELRNAIVDELMNAVKYHPPA